jgi:hypothetical protein
MSKNVLKIHYATYKDPIHKPKSLKCVGSPLGTQNYEQTLVG